MEGGWLVSYVVLWILVLLLSALVLAHSRLLGLLHHRIRPSAARPLADGPELGTRMDRFDEESIDGKSWVWEFPAPRRLLLLFTSPSCDTCTELVPHLKDFVKTCQDPTVVLISTIDHLVMNQAYVGYQRLESFIYIASSEMARKLNVEATPYAILLDRQGIVTAKGVVNHYEHLHSLTLIPDRDSDSTVSSREANEDTILVHTNHEQHL